MLETVTWMDIIMDSLRLKLDADPGFLPTFRELEKIVAQVRSDSSNGFKRCKLVLTRQQVIDGMCMVEHVSNRPMPSSGTYVPQMRPHDINAELQKYQKASNMTIRANEV